MAARVGDSAQVEREGLEVFRDQSRQPGPVHRAISNREVFHDVVVEDCGPHDEGSAERLQATARHLEVRAFLREPARSDRYDRVPQDAEVLRQWKGDAGPAARCERQKIEAVQCLQHAMDAGRDVDRGPQQ